MSKTEETWMDGITTEMMEHICDNLCKYPDQLSEMELEDKCAECKMGRFVCDILNQYNKVNDFENSQRAKLLEQMQRLKERDADTNVHDNDGWIPVRDRMPEDGGKLLYDMELVTLEDGEVCLGVYRNQENEWLTRRQQGETFYTNTHEVIAWQPLPEPYKEK